MTALTFDTLKFVETLKESGFDEKQAKGMSAAIQEVQKANLDELAAKRDLRELESQLSTKADVAKVEMHIQEVKRDIKELKVKIAEAKADMIQWMFGVAAGQAAFIMTIIKMFPSR